MKKVFIIITAVVYALAIIVVAFLGYQAEINHPPVYADDVVLVQETPYQCFENGVLIYSIIEVDQSRNNGGAQIANDESTSNPEIITPRYKVRIYDFEFLYECMDASINLKCKPISFEVDEEGKPREPKNQTVSYTVSKNDSSYVSVDAEGTVKFKEPLDIGSFNLAVSSNDGTKIVTYINIYW